jgi:hypothetical protein
MRTNVGTCQTTARSRQEGRVKQGQTWLSLASVACHRYGTGLGTSSRTERGESAEWAQYGSSRGTSMAVPAGQTHQAGARKPAPGTLKQLYSALQGGN